MCTEEYNVGNDNNGQVEPRELENDHERRNKQSKLLVPVIAEIVRKAPGANLQGRFNVENNEKHVI